ncbi:MAG: hypothetical protein JNL09_09325 [Anaerolineales bacterium]|nr:hypothetical protein [Anaerolineales bacterium]
MANKHRKATTSVGAKTGVQTWQVVVGVLALVAVGVAAFLLNSASQPKVEVTVQGAPSLSVDRNKIDFGDVKLGQTVEASFVVANVGDKPLRFSEPPYVQVVEGC